MINASGFLDNYEILVLKRLADPCSVPQNLNHQPKHHNSPHNTETQKSNNQALPEPKAVQSAALIPRPILGAPLIQNSLPSLSNIRRLLSQKITKVPIEKPPGLLVYRKPKFLADHSLRPHLLQTAVYILDSSVSITIIKNLTDNNRYQNLLIASRVDHSRNF